MIRLTVIHGGAPCCTDSKPVGVEDVLTARTEAAAVGRRYLPDSAEDLRGKFNTGLGYLAQQHAWLDERSTEHLSAMRDTLGYLSGLLDRFEAVGKEGV